MHGESRRSFLAALSSLTGMGLVGGCLPALASGRSAPTGAWDLSWLDDLHGKHRQVFSVGSLVGHLPLHVVTNYLDAHLEVYGLRYPDVNTLVGITDPGFPINASDPIWARYELGRRWQIKDPATNEWATRNVFLENVPAAPGKIVGVRPLMARGTIFWQCNNALGSVVRRFARELNQPVEAIREELVAGLNPGVKLVPAHTMVLGLAQEHGCTYESIG